MFIELSGLTVPVLLTSLANCLVNPQAFFRMVKGLLPKAAQEKLTICPGRTLTQNIATCPFVRFVTNLQLKSSVQSSVQLICSGGSEGNIITHRSHFDVEHLPSFLGGRCHCHDSAGCIPGMANEQSVTNLEVRRLGSLIYLYG